MWDITLDTFGNRWGSSTFPSRIGMGSGTCWVELGVSLRSSQSLSSTITCQWSILPQRPFPYYLVTFCFHVLHRLYPWRIFQYSKDQRKSCSDSSNYRAIALSCPLAKVFDLVLLQQQIDKFQTSELQYGFKPNGSATQCTFSLLEII